MIRLRISDIRKTLKTSIPRPSFHWSPVRESDLQLSSEKVRCCAQSRAFRQFRLRIRSREFCHCAETNNRAVNIAL